MRFRADGDFLRALLTGPAEPKIALSLDGDHLEIEVRLTVRRTAQVAGVDSGLAIIAMGDLLDAVERLPSGAVEIEALGDKVWVRGGPSEIPVECLYERGRP